MKNKSLAKDYITRAAIRLKYIQGLFESESWADVVRECQECVELALKALLRSHGIDIPRIHDVSQIMLDEKQKLPKELATHFEKLATISRSLRRDRELAFYGSEDLTPSEFYKKGDAEEAVKNATFVVSTVSPFVH